MTRVVLYNHSAARSGAELAAPSLARSIGAELWLPEGGPECSLDGERPDTVLRLPKTFDRRPRRLSEWWRVATDITAAQLRVLSRLRRRSASLVVANTVQATLHLALPCLLARVPLVVIVRDLGSGGNRSPRLTAGLAFMLNRFASGVIYNSELTRSSWAVHKPSMVAHTSVAEHFFAHSHESPDRPTFVMVGRLASWKGQRDVVEAVTSLRRDYPEVELLLVGAESFGEGDEVPAGEWGRCVGYVEDPAERMAHASAVVHASRTPEPLGQVIAQAAAVGTPIVCSGLGGHLEWLSPGESCRVIQAGDVADIERQLRWIVENPSEAAVLASRARDAVQALRGDTPYAGLRAWLDGFSDSYEESRR